MFKRLHRGWVIILLFITACGFEPLHGHGTGQVLTDIKVNSIRINPPSEKIVHLLHSKLAQSMQLTKAKSFLDIAVDIRNENYAIQSDSTARRTRVIMRVEYKLLDMKRKLIDSGVIHAIDSFDAVESQYSTLISEEATVESMIKSVVYELKNRLSLK